MFIPAAPSAPPSSVRVTGVTSSTITVQWGMVPCIHQNGPITGYSVRYGVMGSGSSQTETVSGASVAEVTLSSLLKYTKNEWNKRLHTPSLYLCTTVTGQ